MREILGKAMLLGSGNTIHKGVACADAAMALPVSHLLERRPEMGMDTLEWIIAELRGKPCSDLVQQCVELLFPVLDAEARRSVYNRLEWALIMQNGVQAENITGNARKSCDKGLDQRDF